MVEKAMLGNSESELVILHICEGCRDDAIASDGWKLLFNRMKILLQKEKEAFLGIKCNY